MSPHVEALGNYIAKLSALAGESISDMSVVVEHVLLLVIFIPSDGRSDVAVTSK